MLGGPVPIPGIHVRDARYTSGWRINERFGPQREKRSWAWTVKEENAPPQSCPSRLVKTGKPEGPPPRVAHAKVETAPSMPMEAKEGTKPQTAKKSPPEGEPTATGGGTPSPV